MRSIFYTVLLCLLDTFYSLYANAQQHLTHQLTIKDGLPSNVVYNIYQDTKGFLWFFTDHGISQYDGHHFQNYSINNGLPDNEVFDMGEDKFGRLWLVCYNRQPCYILSGKVYTRENDALCRKLDELKIEYKKLINHSDGILFDGRYLCVGYKDSIHVIEPKIKGPIEEIDTLYGKFYVAGLDTMTINHGNKIVTIPYRRVARAHFEKNLLLTIISYNNNYFLYRNKVSEKGLIMLDSIPFPAHCYIIKKYSDSIVLCLTANGIYKYNFITQQLSPSDAYPEGKPFKCIATDNEGNTWLGTDDGVYMYPKIQTGIYNNNSGLIDNNVITLNNQSDGSIIGNFSTGKFAVVDEGKIINVELIGFGKENRVLFAYKLQHENFLVGCDRGLYIVNSHGANKPLITYAAFKACQKKGNLYYIAQSNGAVLYDSHSGKLSYLWGEKTTSIAADEVGNVWLGTLIGLNFYANGTVRRFDRDSTLSGSRITSLVCMYKGSLVIATHRNGLFIWDGSHLQNIDKTKGLSSNNCIKLTADSENHLWLCTDKGLDRITFSRASLTDIYHYSAADGLPTEKINDITISGDNLYVATTEGIVLLKKNTKRRTLLPPKVYITAVITHDTTLTYPDRPIILPYNQNDLQITYTGISLSSGADIQYRYVLEGAGADTVFTSGNNLNLSAVRPGRYRLLLWARISGESTWSDTPASLPFIVRLPFWLTWQFQALTGFIVAGLIILLYRHKVRAIRRAAAEKGRQQQQIAELEMQALRAQINPHFLFNSLNSIQHFYAQADERQANRYLSLFAQLIRKTLNHSKTPWLSLTEELNMLTTYIDLEQMRFKNAFSYKVIIDQALSPNDIRIPAMLIQPYVENAINHGLRPLEGEKGLLVLQFEPFKNGLRCTIDDNGIGIEQGIKRRKEGHKSLGMDINRQRIRTMNDLYKTDINLSITDKSTIDQTEHGTIVVFTITNIQS